MMTSKPELPSNKKPVLDGHGKKRCDAGKKVKVTSVGGALVNQEGVVVDGPYWWTIDGLIKDKNGKLTIRHQWDSVPYWLVRLSANGFYHRFSEQELVF